MLPFGIGHYLNSELFWTFHIILARNQVVWDLTWSSVSYIVDGITRGKN